MKTIEENFHSQEITKIRGILNGSTNWLLSEMQKRNINLEEALSRFREQYGEECSLDLTGKDEANKLIILVKRVFGQTISDLNQIRVESITNMENHFYEMAAARGLKIKSIATAYLKNGVLQLKVQPELISKEDALYHEEYDTTALILQGIDRTKILKGKRNQETEDAALADLQEILNEGIYQRQSSSRLLRSA